MAKLKKNVPSPRKREKREKENQANKQALVIHGRVAKAKRASSEASFIPAITASSLRSASRPRPSGAIINLCSDSDCDEDLESEYELAITYSRRCPKLVTPRRTPRHRRPSKHQQKRNFPITTPRYLTPPDSGSSGSSRQTNNHRISKIGISNFKANLIAASRLSLRPSDDDNDDDNVQVIGTRLNVGYRATGHSWTMEERKFLVMLKRFWVADLLAITTIMNALFPKALVPFKSRMVNMQYQEISAGKQCGDDADIAWDIVWNTIDFSLASRKFQPVLEKFEEMAAGVGVAITRRVEEDDRQAIYADRRKHIPKRSTIQRRETSHTERVVRGSQAAVPAKVRAGDIANAASYSEAQAQRQAIVEMRADIPLVRNDDPIQNGFDQDRDFPTSLYRAFSSESAGLNSVEGFRAAQFIARMNAVPPALDPTSNYFAWNASNHLSPTGDVANRIATPFISLSPSLVWCVQRLYKLEGDEDSKRFAIINGPMVDAHTRLYKTGPILRQLKNSAMYSKTVRYKATLEYFAWAEIRGEAISTVISRIHLETLSGVSPAVRSLLRLSVLDKTNSIAQARAIFKAHPVHLDGRVGMAIGKICLLFGISFHSDQAVITETVYHLLQGWAVQIEIDDEESQRESQKQAFGAFIEQLDTSDGSIELATARMRPKLKNAFEKGVHQAAQQLLKESLRRPKKKTRHNRSNLYDRAIN